MKHLLFLLAIQASAASCLKIDSLTPTVAPCESGTCNMGPGVVGEAEMRAMLLPQYQVVGHNTCAVKQPLKGSFTVEVAFYNKDGFRIGVGAFYVASLDGSEKFKHSFDIPYDVRVNGPVASIKVRSIAETVVIPGQANN